MVGTWEEAVYNKLVSIEETDMKTSEIKVREKISRCSSCNKRKKIKRKK